MWDEELRKTYAAAQASSVLAEMGRGRFFGIKVHVDEPPTTGWAELGSARFAKLLDKTPPEQRTPHVVLTLAMIAAVLRKAEAKEV